MKLLVITLTAVLSILNLKSNATDAIINPDVLKSFNSSFVNATDIKWSATENLYKADFSYNGQYVTAFFDAEGEVVGVTKNISSVQLPVTLQAKLKKNYNGYWITDLFEVNNEGGVAYYATLENADTKLIVTATPGTNWSIYKKERKS